MPVINLISIIIEICCLLKKNLNVFFNHIGGVVDGVVDHGFEPRTIELVFVATPQSIQHEGQEKNTYVSANIFS
jgi:hypothetical protein